jgi:hypothetical protein
MSLANLETQNYAQIIPGGFPERIEADRIENANNAKIEAILGAMTASFNTTFFVSGAMIDKVNNAIGGAVNADNPRVFRECKAWCVNSGSGALVTTFDVQLSSSAGWTSIFSNDKLRPHLSSSAGVAINSQTTFSTSTWNAGQALRAIIKDAAGGDAGAGAQSGVTLAIYWKPSASFGA